MKNNKSKKLIHYDRHSDVFYIGLKSGDEEEYVEIAPGVGVEMGENGQVLGPAHQYQINMDKWIKENKIFITIIIFLMIALGIVYFSKQSPKTESDLSLQAKCSDMAGRYFLSRGYKDGFDYKNHLNSKLNKCFILISSYDANTDLSSVDLYDAVENKHYALYIGHNICNVDITNNPKKCQWDSGNIWFDGNDTKNPADFTVGFRGLKNGGGAGDETTQKQFMDHIQPFMSE